MFKPKNVGEFNAWLIRTLRRCEDPEDVIVSVLEHEDGVIVAVPGGDRYLLRAEKYEG